MLALLDDPLWDALLREGGAVAVLTVLVFKFLAFIKQERAASQAHIEKITAEFSATIKEIHDRQERRDAELMRYFSE